MCDWHHKVSLCTIHYLFVTVMPGSLQGGQGRIVLGTVQTHCKHQGMSLTILMDKGGRKEVSLFLKYWWKKWLHQGHTGSLWRSQDFKSDPLSPSPVPNQPTNRPRSDQQKLRRLSLGMIKTQHSQGKLLHQRKGSIPEDLLVVCDWVCGE